MLSENQIKRIAINAAIEVAEKTADAAAEKAAAKVALGHDEISELVSDTVKQTLLQLGVDSGEPIEMQRDFQHLRQWRRAGEDLRSKGMLALLSIFITGLVSLVLVGVKHWTNP